MGEIIEEHQAAVSLAQGRNGRHEGIGTLEEPTADAYQQQRCIHPMSRSWVVIWHPASLMYSNKRSNAGSDTDYIEEHPVASVTGEACLAFLVVWQVDDVKDEDDHTTHSAKNTQKKATLEAEAHTPCTVRFVWVVNPTSDVLPHDVGHGTGNDGVFDDEGVQEDRGFVHCTTQAFGGLADVAWIVAVTGVGAIRCGVIFGWKRRNKKCLDLQKKVLIPTFVHMTLYKLKHRFR